MSVIWTQADIDTLHAAVVGGLLSVKYAGPPQREITYQSLDSMRSLLAEMNRQVSSAPTHRKVQWKKGY